MIKINYISAVSICNLSSLVGQFLIETIKTTGQVHIGKKNKKQIREWKWFLSEKYIEVAYVTQVFSLSWIDIGSGRWSTL